ncbi:UNVERIFIED_CONTAM: hypothetical protein FKN15_022886 [Acipenser sinensis]
MSDQVRQWTAKGLELKKTSCSEFGEVLTLEFHINQNNSLAPELTAPTKDRTPGFQKPHREEKYCLLHT